MNEDRVKGKAKDIAGRVERQVGEWTGDTEAQVTGAAKQAEGKVQNAWGKTKDAVKDASKKPASDTEEQPRSIEEEEEADENRHKDRRAS